MKERVELIVVVRHIPQDFQIDKNLRDTERHDTKSMRHDRLNDHPWTHMERSIRHQSLSAQRIAFYPSCGKVYDGGCLQTSVILPHEG